MGAPFGIELYDIHGDIDGLALGVEMEMVIWIPWKKLIFLFPEEDAPEAQLAVAFMKDFSPTSSGQLLDLLFKIWIWQEVWCDIGNGIIGSSPVEMMLRVVMAGV